MLEHGLIGVGLHHLHQGGHRLGREGGREGGREEQVSHLLIEKRSDHPAHIPPSLPPSLPPSFLTSSFPTFSAASGLSSVSVARVMQHPLEGRRPTGGA